MTVWYDVSELVNWRIPNLTGIQRTSVGILNGLVDCGVTPRLFRFDSHQNRFEAVDVHDLTDEVIRHLPWVDGLRANDGGSEAPAALPEGASPKKKRWINRDAIFGTTEAAGDLRCAMREFRRATKQLGKQLLRWTWVRFNFKATDPRATSQMCRTAPEPVSPASAGSFGCAGDIVLSTCPSWTIPGHAEAFASLRAHGLVVLRMIYDLIPTIKPQWVDEATSRQVTRWVNNLLTASDGVLTISEFSRGEIVAYCEERRLPVPAISVVRLGDVLESASDPTPPMPRFVPRRPFFLCVSTLDIRKNHRLLYDAWQVLATRDPARCPDLVCLGLRHLHVADLLHEIRCDRTVNGRIHFLHRVTDKELAWYYRHCAATIYPSRYEGWGLPVAESLAHGRLCLASHATSIPEISPDLPAFFDPFDVYGLVALVERTLSDPAWVTAREEAIKTQFRPTPWSHTASQVMAAAEEARAARLKTAAA